MNSENTVLRERLDELTRPEIAPGESIDVVVTMYEINDRHGTGPLVKRVVQGGQRIFAIRARSDWGYQDFGDWSAVISHKGLSRRESVDRVKQTLGGYSVRHVMCVPYLPDELVTSIALHDEFSGKICTWIMDDQNIASHGIPDDLMRELLAKSSLRLATHPELCRAYERKYGFPFFILPAVVPNRLIANNDLENSNDLATPTPRKSENSTTRKVAVIGSFWLQSWFNSLCNALEQCDAETNWYGNNSSRWLRFPEKDLARAGITAHGVIPEEQLARELRRHSMVIVPVGTLDHEEPNPGVIRLSLPGRILFAAAASNTPILIVGSDKTCGARFVQHFDLGEVVPYNGAALRGAMDRLARPEIQAEKRANARRIAPALSDRGIRRWLVDSTEIGEPVDQRFERLFSTYEPDDK